MTNRRFQFKLEPIRALRKDAEQAVMRQLAGELAAVEVLRSELQLAEALLAQAHRPPEGLMTAQELAARQLYAERLERERAEAEARVLRQEGYVDQTRRRLAEASRKRSTLDQLESRRRAVHEAEMRRVEAIEGNELSLLNHLRSELVS
jgi:flagellar export protein FliJ